MTLLTITNMSYEKCHVLTAKAAIVATPVISSITHVADIEVIDVFSTSAVNVLNVDGVASTCITFCRWLVQASLQASAHTPSAVQPAALMS